MRAGRRDVPITHADKVLFDADGITKADLAAYYRDAAPQMVPLVRDRPVSMQRFNAGIAKGGFFQKNLPKGAPGWLKTATVPKRDGTVTHPLVTDAAALVWLANQNCITPHVWSARADRPERPDRMIFDLDPSDDDFGLVRRSALMLGEILREAGVEPWAMTTGSRGLHVVVALRRRHGYTAVRDAAVTVGEELVARNPDELTLAFLKEKRGGRLYVDVNRNGYAATAVAPFGVRPRPGAPVATPLRWEELEDPGLAPDRWTLRDVLDRAPGAWDGVPGAAGALPRT
ncbi:MAG: non-homologous end-joining DNA ligase [Actinomycetota bacterium]|nr:non-homologous end-joining DNA ligase [Actinomycetota bacterium]